MDFETLKRKTGHYFDKAVKKGSDAYEAGKVKLAIHKAERKMEEYYYQIGEVVYANKDKIDTINGELNYFFKEIDTLKQEISQLECEAQEDSCDFEQDAEIVDEVEE